MREEKRVPSKRGDSSTEGSGPSVDENVEILVIRTQVRKNVEWIVLRILRTRASRLATS